MRATELLKIEHGAIERVLETFENVTDRLEAGKTVSNEVLEDSVGFLDRFVDGRHYAKEERALFPLLLAVGEADDKGIVAEILAEHGEIRGQVQALLNDLKRYRAREPGAEQSLVVHARAYIFLLTQHISREERDLLPMAARLLSDHDDQELAAKFTQIDSEYGAGLPERYHHLIDSLAGKVRTLTHTDS